jgi:hypothetical protein
MRNNSDAGLATSVSLVCSSFDTASFAMAIHSPVGPIHGKTFWEVPHAALIKCVCGIMLGSIWLTLQNGVEGTIAVICNVLVDRVEELLPWNLNYA